MAPSSLFALSVALLAASRGCATRLHARGAPVALAVVLTRVLPYLQSARGA